MGNCWRRRHTGVGAVPLAALPLLLLLAGCELSVGGLSGRATDDWVRTYHLSPGGELQIANTNGIIEVEGTDDTEIHVRAERVARAATDAGAREMLPRIKIREDVSPDRVSIETERIGGFMFGVSTEVRYHVQAPRATAVRATSGNGRITLTALSGHVTARTTNGGVTGKELSGAVTAGTTNGGVSIAMASVGAGPIELRTTNGGVALKLPPDANADIDASCTNGGIHVDGLKLQADEQSRRRVSGRLNAGGTPITLHTTNGGIRVTAATASAAPAR